MKYKVRKFIVLFGMVFAVLGIFILCISVSVHMREKSFMEKALQTTAVITDIVTKTRHTSDGKEIDHYVYVEYEVDGTEYEQRLNHYSSSMRIGDTVEINYAPDNPASILSAPGVQLLVVLPVALIFTAVGVCFIVAEIKRAVKVNRLIQQDMFIYCDNWYEGASRTTVNNVRYNEVRCEYVDEMGRQHVFTSAAYHPAKCPFFPRQMLKVYVDLENDPKVHYIPFNQ